MNIILINHSLEIQTLCMQDFPVKQLWSCFHSLAKTVISNENAHFLYQPAYFFDFKNHFDHDTFFNVGKLFIDIQEAFFLGPHLYKLIEKVVQSLDGIFFFVDDSPLRFNFNEFNSFSFKEHACFPKCWWYLCNQHLMCLGWSDVEDGATQQTKHFFVVQLFQMTWKDKLCEQNWIHSGNNFSYLSFVEDILILINHLVLFQHSILALEIVFLLVWFRS